MNQQDTLHDPDENLTILNENQDHFKCSYCSTDSFKQLKQQFSKNGLSIMCFNIRSFNKNGDEFLGYLSNCEHVFDIIILTETWAKGETNTLCYIPGYNSTHNFRENRRGGGVSIFVRDSINYNVIETIDISNDYMESVGITFQCKLS